MIQERAIPFILEGKDILARARTGSGKTGAYLLPLIQRILTLKSTAREQLTRALVLAPSKELCQQIHMNCNQLTSSCSRDIKIVDISAQEEINSIKSILNERPDIIICTPSRILAHLQANHLNLKDSLQFFIIDEADLIFSFGFEQDFKKLLQYLPKVYQAVLASATLSEEVIELKKLVLHDPVILKLEEPLIPSSYQLSHYIIRVSIVN